MVPVPNHEPGSFGESLARYYQHAKSGPLGSWLDALTYLVLAFATTGHWSTYVFMLLFVLECAQIALEQWYWRVSAPERVPVVESTESNSASMRLYRSPMFGEMTRRQSDWHAAVQAAGAVELILRLVNQGSFEEAAFVQSWFDAPTIVPQTGYVVRA